MSASSPELRTSPVPIRTWKMEGPPEIVDGMVMKVMTSCSLRPASRARNPPIAWMPSCELPASRMIASEILEVFLAESGCGGATIDASLIKSPAFFYKKRAAPQRTTTPEDCDDYVKSKLNGRRFSVKRFARSHCDVFYHGINPQQFRRQHLAFIQHRAASPAPAFWIAVVLLSFRVF